MARQSPLLAQTGAVASFSVEAPRLVLKGIAFEVKVEARDARGDAVIGYEGQPVIRGLRRETETSNRFTRGQLLIPDAFVSSSGEVQIVVFDSGSIGTATVRAIPGVLSTLPPLLAILLALVFRQVVVSLAAGIWLGAVFLFNYDLLGGVFRVLDYFLVNVFSDPTRVQIILFSMLFGGMVGVITRNGGARGIANLITRYARTPRGGQLAAWGMAFFLFFDDYANVLVRGNLMRPITDRLRISREKLSFIVDTGAATVASIFIISTWIGYEVGLIEQGLRMINSSESAYSIFIRTIPYRYYPILALFLAFLIAVTGRDMGPMLSAERRARLEGKLLRDGAQPATDLSADGHSLSVDAPARWINGLLPVFTILAVGIFGLYWTGTNRLVGQGIDEYGIAEIMTNADSYMALLWASLSGCIVSIVLSVGQRILDLTQAMEAWVQGLKAMMLAMLILVLAWSLGSVTEELHTADYLVQVLRGVLSPFWLPALTFVIASLVAFSTGTSWATMAILMPLVIPLAYTLGTDAQLVPQELDRVLLGVISSVLAGAVFGDHCSPISDTTILSSMSSACDHIDHVRTQLPYALVAAVAGVLAGDIPSAYGLSPWISIILGMLIIAGILLAFGKKPEAAWMR